MRDERHKQELILSCLLAAATILVFWQIGSHGFIVYDDPEYVYENPFVRMGFTSSGLSWAFTTFHSANWHPVTWLSHMIDVQLFGLDPRGHHITSLLLHTANALLLFLLLYRLTGFIWRGLVVAAFFALHPLHVESVAWIAERKDLLSTFLGLLTLYLYAGYTKSPSMRRYLILILVFAAGLMAKPMLVTIPFILLLLDFWPLGRIKSPGTVHLYNDRILLRQLFLEKIPFMVLAGISGAITIYAQQSVGAVKSLSSYPFPSRVANAMTAYADYLQKMIWPVKLAVFYPFPTAISWVQLIAASGLLAAISATAFLLKDKKPYILFGWLWYLGTLVPVIGLVQVGGQASADRYTYIPLIGIFILIVWWICDCTAGRKYQNTVLAASAALALAGCATFSMKQLTYWRNDITLFSHALTVTENNYIAHNNLGFALASVGNFSEAGRHFNEAIRISPTFADAWLNQGGNFLRTGDIDKSIAFISRAIELRPGFAAAYNDLGVAMIRKGRLQEAYANLNMATELAPLMADGSYNKGVVMSLSGRSNEAIDFYARALQLSPENPGYHARMGAELVRVKKFREAINHLSEALRLNSDDAETRQLLETLKRTSQ